MNRQGITVLQIFLIIILLSCTQSVDISGGSTTVENPFIIIAFQSDSSLEGTKVSLYPHDFNPLTDDTNSVRIRISDISGTVRFDSIPQGTYSVISSNGALSSIHYPLAVTEATKDTIEIKLTPLASARVHSETTTESVYFLGTPVVATKSSDTLFTLPALPLGNFPPLVIRSPEQISTQEGVSINEQSENDIYPDKRTLTLKQVFSNESNDTNTRFTSVVSTLDQAWFGTDSSGIWSYDGEQLILKMTGDENSLFSKSIVEISTGSPWISSDNPENYLMRTPEGSLHFHDDIGDRIEENKLDPFPYTTSNALHMDSSGRSWVAYDTVVCFTDDNGEWTGRLELHDIITIAGDYDSFLYLGDSQGKITVMNKDTTFTVDIAPLSSVQLNDLVVDNSGSLIAATNNGLHKFMVGNSFTVLSSVNRSIKKVLVGESDMIYGFIDKNTIFYKSETEELLFENVGGESFTITDISYKGQGELYLTAGKSGALICSFSD